jgi:hypothetical protein
VQAACRFDLSQGKITPIRFHFDMTSVGKHLESPR